MLNISLVIITKNEQHRLELCIRSVPFAKDVVVLDSDSTDQTREVAKSLGARVFVEPWRGFGLQKQRAVELAKYDWVLCLDADEALSFALSSEIEAILKGSEPVVDGFECPRISFHLGRWIRHGGWYPDWQLRFFDRRKARWSSAAIHETVRASSVARLKGDIEHLVFRDLSHQIETNNRYSSLMAEELRARGVRFSFAKLLLKPWSKFLETYVWKRGFLDGVPGFMISVGAAYSVFLKFSKLWELEKLSSSAHDVPKPKVL